MEERQEAEACRLKGDGSGRTHTHTQTERRLVERRRPELQQATLSPEVLYRGRLIK